MTLTFRVAFKYLESMEFTPEEWEKYQDLHPNADPKKHTIKKKPVKKRIMESLQDAPKKVKRFVSDESFRNKSLKELAKKLRESPEKIKKSIIHAGKAEVKAIFVETPKILVSIVKERRKPTREEMKTLYGVGVYVAGTILSLQGDSATAAALAASKAFGHSLTLHIAFRSMSSLIDEGFLAYEALESAATAGGIASKLPFSTSSIPGLNIIWEAIGKLVVGKTQPTLETMIESLLSHCGDVLEKGISDEEMKKILS